MKTLAILFGPALGVFLALFVPVYLTADPGGVWPPLFVAVFTAAPISFATFDAAALFLVARWIRRRWCSRETP